VNFTQVAREDGRAVSGLDPDEMTRGEIEGRRQAMYAIEALRRYTPGCELPGERCADGIGFCAMSGVTPTKELAARRTKTTLPKTCRRAFMVRAL
jgi:hypothetical protein